MIIPAQPAPPAVVAVVGTSAAGTSPNSIKVIITLRRWQRRFNQSSSKGYAIQRAGDDVHVK